MNKTSIEWVKNPDGTQGYTWNPITGCLNGCLYCYARRLANGRLKARYRANDNLAPTQKDLVNYSLDPFYPRFWPERVAEIFNEGKKAKGVFVCDMSDLFGIGVPEEWTRQVLNRCRMSPQHRFYLLTKQPQNLIKFSPFPDNCYVGVTTTNTDMAVEGLTLLKDIQAPVKYMSFEPLLSHIPLTANAISDINWVILGSQTKPTMWPNRHWIKEIATACDEAGIPLFLKDNLKLLLLFDQESLVDTSLVSNRGLLRQEMPEDVK